MHPEDSRPDPGAAEADATATDEAAGGDAGEAAGEFDAAPRTTATAPDLSGDEMAFLEEARTGAEPDVALDAEGAEAIEGAGPDEAALTEAIEPSYEPEGEPAAEDAAGDDLPASLPSRMKSILGSVLFAAERPLGLKRLKELLGERDGKAIKTALDLLAQALEGTGIALVEVAEEWQLRTDPENGAWVQRQTAAKPVRLSRPQLETLAIIAYRQPITRPEIDEIRGVDGASTVKMLFERGLLRSLGHREEVGRPQLYGTTDDFLRFFHLRSLAELPTLREFHELSEDSRAQVDALAQGELEDGEDNAMLRGRAEWTGERPDAVALAPVDPQEDEALLAELDEAAERAERVVETVNPKPASPETPQESKGNPS